MNTEKICTALEEQYGAAFNTLEKIINICPNEIWINSPNKPPIYGVVNHILYFVDLYFSKSKEERESYKPKFPDEQDDMHMLRTLEKNDLLEYTKEMRSKAKKLFASMTLKQLQGESVFEWHGSSLLSSLLYNLRHVMLHIGALQVRLRHYGIDEKFWVSNADL
ncbi:MAG: DinB family protein [Promethearchaeota archaeon]